MVKYSTTKTLVNKIVPGTFRQPYQGLGTALSLSSNMMLGIAFGAVGMVMWCKHSHKIQGRAA